MDDPTPHGPTDRVRPVTGGWRRNPDVLDTRIDDEVVLLHPSTQQMFVLNETGAVLWDQIEAGADLDVIVTAITSTFEVDDAVARADAAELLGQLADADLVRAG
jgi:hypothetical protein